MFLQGVCFLNKCPFWTTKNGNKEMNNENQKKLGNLEIGDVVIYKTLFTLMTGRISKILKDEEINFTQYRIKGINFKSRVSEFIVNPEDIIEIVEQNNFTLDPKKIFLTGAYIIFNTDGKTLTGRIKEVLNHEYIINTVNNDFEEETHRIKEKDIIVRIR